MYTPTCPMISITGCMKQAFRKGGIDIARFPELWLPSGVHLPVDPHLIADSVKTMSDEQYYALKQVAEQQRVPFSSVVKQYHDAVIAPSQTQPAEADEPTEGE